MRKKVQKVFLLHISYISYKGAKQNIIVLFDVVPKHYFLHFSPKCFLTHIEGKYDRFLNVSKKTYTVK
jgi:hypothetical protein